jgi:hypothetical protein
MNIDVLRSQHLELLKRFIIRYDLDTNAYSLKKVEIYSGRLRVFQVIAKLLPQHWVIAEPEKVPSLEERERGLDWPKTAESMIGLVRMNQLHTALDTIRLENVEGDIVETGIWRGGAVIFAASYLKIFGITSKRVYGCDSFEGLPKPDPKYPIDAGDEHSKIRVLAVSIQEVERNVLKYGLDFSQIELVKGWFVDTLTSLKVESISILRLDGDMYSSTIQALEALYHKVSVGGYVIIDDYCLRGAREAIHDFFKEKSLPKIIDIDGIGAYFRREE